MLEDIANDILEQKCLLVLGAGIAIDTQEKLLRTVFYEQLYEKYHDRLPEDERIITGYNAQDELFIFAKSYPDPDVVSAVRKFYDKTYTSDLFGKLALLPFHLVVNTVPDENFAKILPKDQHFSTYFDKNKNDSNEINEFFLKNKENGKWVKPVVYNLLGSYKDEETLIITHRNMFDFIKEVLKEDRIPTALMTAINAVSRIVFLGVEFDKWYVQLILQLLTHKRKKGFKGYAEEQDLDKNIKTAYEKDFNINFIIKEIPKFVEELLAYFQANHAEKLRTLQRITNEESKVAKEALESAKMQEIRNLEAQLTKLLDLKSDYELNIDLESDPATKMSQQMKLEKLEVRIEEIRRRLRELGEE